ncbi:MAG: branched-chain amino acid ABC transporter permease [Desulfurococcales archaeon]|nr:branched-chain amino acid ABC transporter permease [Desulfurococcales archaeon]
MGFLPNGTFVMASIAYASALGLLSMGLSLTFVTTRIANFAHATIGMIGAFVLTLLVDRVYYTGPSYQIFITAPVLSFLLAGAFAVFMYIVIMKPLADRGNGVTELMIATFAVDIILINILSYLLNAIRGVHIPKLIGLNVSSWDARIHCCGVILQASYIVLPIAAILLTLAFHFFLTKTKFGVAMRATIENPDLAEVMGVNTNMVYTVSWFISGGLAGVAGSLLAFSLKDTSPNDSALIIVSVFAGSIVGGLSHVYWGLIGGFIVGLMEKLGTGLLDNFYNQLLAPALGWTSFSMINYEKLMSLGLVVVILLFAPEGLAGVDWGKYLRKIKRRW